MTRSKRGGARRKTNPKPEGKATSKADRESDGQAERDASRKPARKRRRKSNAKADRETTSESNRGSSDKARSKTGREATPKPDREPTRRSSTKSSRTKTSDTSRGRDAGRRKTSGETKRKSDGKTEAKTGRQTGTKPSRQASSKSAPEAGRESGRKARSKPAPEAGRKASSKASRKTGRKASSKSAPEADRIEGRQSSSTQEREPRRKATAAEATPQPASATTVRGTYAGHPRGFGFLATQTAGDDLFIPPQHEGAAIDGDSVEAELGQNGTARITRVVSRGRKLLVGTYLGNGLFEADAHRIAKPLVVEGEATRGDKVLVATAKQKLVIRKVLGQAGDPDVEDNAVLVELDITPKFPKPVLAESRALEPPNPKDDRGRLDLRKATTVVTIDPVTSRDFDDAVSLERRGDDWLLGVHIADVSHYVKPGTALDREAYRRGTSVYLPGRVIPMLPERLSNDLCSLREGVDRLAMTVLLRYGPKGQLLETTFAESVIRSDRRFSYERASRVMDGATKERGGVGTVLLDMARLARMLRKNRPSFDLPRQELELVYGGRGEVVDLKPTSLDVAHGVIEEFMLAANREVARLLLRKNVAAIYRHHPEPEDLSRVWADFRRLSCPRAEQQGLSKAMAAATKKGYGPAATAAVLRCMPRAVYATGSTTHFSLGFEAYTHFTSPIRRYADLVVHRQLRSLLEQARGKIKLRPAKTLPGPTADKAMEKVAVHATERALSAERAESRIRRHRLLEYMATQKPARITGQITMVVERGFSVDLPPFGTWGFAPTDTLNGGPFKFEPGQLRGAKRTFQLGDTLDVEIARIDAAANELELRPV